MQVAERSSRAIPRLQFAEFPHDLAVVLLVGVDAFQFEHVAFEFVERDVEGGSAP